jgi:release factor glutamine methyltransferase
MNSVEYIDKIRRDLTISSNFILKIISNYFQKDPIDIKINNFDITQKDIKILNKVFYEDFPIEYVVNRVEFLGKEFYVDENVLIPRPETEDLVLLAEKIIKENNYKRILDLATGSGVIAISLELRNPDLIIYASDISEKALKIAKKNSEKHDVKIHFSKSDIFNNLENMVRDLDFIVSNPPYVEEEKRYLDSTIKYEPKEALFAGKDGQNFFRKLVKNEKIIKNKTLLFETTEFNYIKTVNILSGIGKTEIIEDSFGIKRFVKLTT